MRRSTSWQPVRYWIDALIASDPGLSRLIQALQVTAGIGVTIAAEYGFAQLAHPFWMSAPSGARLTATEAAALSAQHHGLTVLAMLLGGIVGMISSLAVTDTTRRGQTITMIWMPVPLLATLALSIKLAPHRAVGLVGLALVMGLGTYMRKFAPRFGPRVVMYGMLLFMGYFFGFLAGSELPIGQIYWTAAILWLAVLVNLALRLLIFNAVAARVLVRSRRSLTARARGVLAAAAEVLEAPDPAAVLRARRRLARQLIRLNESAITMDGQLADPRLRLKAGEGQALHTALFELELHLQNLGRAVGRLAEPDTELDPERRAGIHGWLVGASAGDASDAAAYQEDGVRDETVGTALATDNVIFAVATTVVEVAQSLARWQRGELPAIDIDEVDFSSGYESPVMLFAGNLAGSSPASVAAVSPDAGHGLAARLRLDTPAMTAIRVALAVGAASAIGSAVNEKRFYWAVIAVFISFMGANTTAEQIIKAANRVIGTCVGIVLGSLLANAIGPSTWSIAVILVAITFGVYFLRVSYSLMVMGITVMVSMLYVDLGEFSNGLLLDRLELTAIGAAIAMLSALLIFPVRTQRVVHQAVLNYLDSLSALFGHLSTILGEMAEDELPTRTVTTDARHLDDSLQQLLVTARPLARNPLRRDELSHNLQMFVLSAHFARNLAASADAGAARTLDVTERKQLAAAVTAQSEAIRDLKATILGGAPPDQVSNSSVVDTVVEAGRSLAAHGIKRSDPSRRMLRALSGLDAALVQIGVQLADT